jgi:hypothetical protein
MAPIDSIALLTLAKCLGSCLMTDLPMSKLILVIFITCIIANCICPEGKPVARIKATKSSRPKRALIENQMFKNNKINYSDFGKIANQSIKRKVSLYEN